MFVGTRAYALVVMLVAPVAATSAGSNHPIPIAVDSHGSLSGFKKPAMLRRESSVLEHFRKDPSTSLLELEGSTPQLGIWHQLDGCCDGYTHEKRYGPSCAGTSEGGAICEADAADVSTLNKCKAKCSGDCKGIAYAASANGASFGAYTEQCIIFEGSCSDSGADALPLGMSCMVRPQPLPENWIHLTGRCINYVDFKRYGPLCKGISNGRSCEADKDSVTTLEDCKGKCSQDEECSAVGWSLDSTPDLVDQCVLYTGGCHDSGAPGAQNDAPSQQTPMYSKVADGVKCSTHYQNGWDVAILQPGLDTATPPGHTVWQSQLIYTPDACARYCAESPGCTLFSVGNTSFYESPKEDWCRISRCTATLCADAFDQSFCNRDPTGACGAGLLDTYGLPQTSTAAACGVGDSADPAGFKTSLYKLNSANSSAGFITYAGCGKIGGLGDGTGGWGVASDYVYNMNEMKYDDIGTCKDRCKEKGTKYFGFTCPRADNVQCMCSNVDPDDPSESDRGLDDEFCEGSGDPPEAAFRGDCIGKAGIGAENTAGASYTAGAFKFGGYRLGDASVASRYRVDTSLIALTHFEKPRERNRTRQPGDSGEARCNELSCSEAGAYYMRRDAPAIACLSPDGCTIANDLRHCCLALDKEAAGKKCKGSQALNWLEFTAPDPLEECVSWAVDNDVTFFAAGINANAGKCWWQKSEAPSFCKADSCCECAKPVTSADYTKIVEGQICDGQYSRVEASITTVEACAQACIDSPGCTVFSAPGPHCRISACDKAGAQGTDKTCGGGTLAGFEQGSTVNAGACSTAVDGDATQGSSAVYRVSRPDKLWSLPATAVGAITEPLRKAGGALVPAEWPADYCIDFSFTAPSTELVSPHYSLEGYGGNIAAIGKHGGSSDDAHNDLYIYFMKGGSRDSWKGSEGLYGLTARPFGSKGPVYITASTIQPGSTHTASFCYAQGANKPSWKLDGTAPEQRYLKNPNKRFPSASERFDGVTPVYVTVMAGSHEQDNDYDGLNQAGGGSITAFSIRAAQACSMEPAEWDFYKLS